MANERGMPEAVWKVFELLKRVVLWLHACWAIYRGLYEHTEERRQLQKELAGHFSYVVENLLCDNLVLTLCKLTDPAEWKRREQFSFKQLGDHSLEQEVKAMASALKDKCKPSGIDVEFHKLVEPGRPGAEPQVSLRQLENTIRNKGDSSLADKIKPMVEALEGKCEPLRPIRNELLAHLNLERVMKKNIMTFPSKKVEAALQLLRKIMNGIQVHYEHSEQWYNALPSAWVDPVILTLTDAKRYRDLLAKAVSVPSAINLNDRMDPAYPEA